MPFDSGIVAEINAKVELLAYVSQFATLKRRGREYVGLCPFHSEKTPSFSLNAEKGLWHCYGCGKGGDLIKFVETMENVDFSGAIELLAKRAGIEVRESPGERRRRSEREAIFEANAAARAYFTASLKRSDAARAYLERRGVKAGTAEKFSIGFAPDSWDGLTSALRNAGIDLGVAERAGLVRARPQGDGCYDFFRNRLMFPIHNLTGEVMAFGGRALGDETPKYINTPNTPAYTKGKHVYALDLARRSGAADGTLIVVEGYMDAVVLHQAGIDNAVASLGTAFTPEQARELRRVAWNLYLCFDGDTAGQDATARSIDMLIDEGLSVEVVALPAGTDPDEFVRERGAAAFRALLDASTPWKDFKLAAAFARSEKKFSNPAEIARSVMQVVAQERDPIVRDRYVKAISRQLDIGENALRRIALEGRPQASTPTTDDESRMRAPRRGPAPTSIERELLRLLVSRPSLLERIDDAVSPDEFEDATLGAAFGRLLAHEDEVAAGLNPIALFADDPIGDELTRMVLDAPPLSAEDDIQRLSLIVERFARRRMERRLSRVDQEVNDLLTQGLPVPERLREEHHELASSLRGSRAERKEG
jgi:DNA primase